MSRLIKKQILITSGVTITQNDDILNFKGPKGELSVKLTPGVGIRIDGENLWIEKKNEKASSAMLGTIWALSRNAVEGVVNGFSKILEIEGVGYKAELQGNEIVLNLGFSKPIRVQVKDGISVAVEKNTIKVSGIDKDQVGLFSAKVRALKKPEPYKGKGIHYKGEVIRRKLGKKAGAA